MELEALVALETKIAVSMEETKVDLMEEAEEEILVEETSAVVGGEIILKEERILEIKTSMIESPKNQLFKTEVKISSERIKNSFTVLRINSQS